MKLEKKLGFGLGTLFSLIVSYFIYLYADEKGWTLLAFLSKWFLIISVIFIALPVLLVILVLLFSLILLLISALRLKMAGKKYKKPQNDYVDAEFKIRE